MFPTSGPLFNTTAPSPAPTPPQNGLASSGQAMPAIPPLPAAPTYPTASEPSPPPPAQNPAPASFTENPVSPPPPPPPPPTLTPSPPTPAPEQPPDPQTDQEYLEDIPDTTLETIAAGLPEEDVSAASLTAPPPPPDPEPEVVTPPEPSPPQPTPAPPNAPLADLLIDVLQHIEAGKDSAATIGITELIKNGYTQEALQLYHTLAINRTSRK